MFSIRSASRFSYVAKVSFICLFYAEKMTNSILYLCFC